MNCIITGRAVLNRRSCTTILNVNTRPHHSLARRQYVYFAHYAFCLLPFPASKVLGGVDSIAPSFVVCYAGQYY